MAITSLCKGSEIGKDDNIFDSNEFGIKKNSIAEENPFIQSEKEKNTTRKVKFRCQYCRKAFTSNKKRFSHQKNRCLKLNEETKLESESRNFISCKFCSSMCQSSKHMWYFHYGKCTSQHCKECKKEFIIRKDKFWHQKNKCYERKNKQVTIVDEEVSKEAVKKLEENAGIMITDNCKQNAGSNLLKKDDASTENSKKYVFNQKINSNTYSSTKQHSDKGTSEVSPDKGELPESCNICGYESSCHQAIYAHKRRHDDTSRYLCNTCKCFVLLSKQQDHIKKCQESSHVCTLCLRGFLSNFNLLMHKKKHSDSSLYFCDKCKRFMLVHKRENHIKCHSKNNVAKPYVKKYKLKDVKVKLTPFKSTVLHCDVCRKMFVTADSYEFHYMQSCFSASRASFLCPISSCSRVFKVNKADNKSVFRRTCDHVRAVHTKEKKYWCECGKGYSAKREFWAHKKRHNDLSLYFCKECKKFKHLSNIREHENFHAKEERERMTDSIKPNQDLGYENDKNENEDLSKHKRETKYNGSIFEKGFTSSATAKRHKIKHSNSSLYFEKKSKQFKKVAKANKHIQAQEKKGEIIEANTSIVKEKWLLKNVATVSSSLILKKNENVAIQKESEMSEPQHNDSMRNDQLDTQHSQTCSTPQFEKNVEMNSILEGSEKVPELEKISVIVPALSMIATGEQTEQKPESEYKTESNDAFQRPIENKPVKATGINAGDGALNLLYTNISMEQEAETLSGLKPNDSRGDKHTVCSNRLIENEFVIASEPQSNFGNETVNASELRNNSVTNSEIEGKADKEKPSGFKYRCFDCFKISNSLEEFSVHLSSQCTRRAGME